MNPEITAAQILADRESRRNAGLAGCMTGRPQPENMFDFFGFRDIQIWNQDASGRMNGDPNFNPRDPICFCFDHRGAFDPTGATDASLVNEGHAAARYTYRNLFPNQQIGNPHPPPALVIPDPPDFLAGDDDDAIPPPGGEPNLANAPGLANVAGPQDIHNEPQLINLAPLANAAPLPDDDDDDTIPMQVGVEIEEPEDDNELENMSYNDHYDDRDDYDDGGYGVDWNESGYFD